jgi:hypothetical protein
MSLCYLLRLHTHNRHVSLLNISCFSVNNPFTANWSSFLVVGAVCAVCAVTVGEIGIGVFVPIGTVAPIIPNVIVLVCMFHKCVFFIRTA